MPVHNNGYSKCARLKPKMRGYVDTKISIPEQLASDCFEACNPNLHRCYTSNHQYTQNLNENTLLMLFVNQKNTEREDSPIKKPFRYVVKILEEKS